MKVMMCCLIGALFLFGSVTIAPAETDITSGNYYLRGCRAAASGSSTYTDAGELFMNGVCIGVVQTLMHFLSPDPLISGVLQPKGLPYPILCIPGEVTTIQAVAVVAKFLDEHPNRLHESFLGLAEEALSKAWPCPFPAKP